MMVLVAIHFVLSWMESHNWIYYRRRPRHGGAQYHLLQMSSVFDPRFQQVVEIMVADERRDDESGGPLGDPREQQRVRGEPTSEGGGRGGVPSSTEVAD